ncbi:MAG: sugar phosphate isomerase/epimerase family protein [Methanomicrobiales archaeon]|nr:sugar phosphate isomerase/epimerase family protein [Methanomicrobiales archaeon]MDI6876353.1 sugar phosphate isomerase/epimerase family protein [Methanomicrobiales archaeon]
MFGISTYCLHESPLPLALDTLAGITEYVEIMDEGYHFLDSSELLEKYSLHYAIHAPSRGVNIASLLEPIRKASLEVIVQCFRIAADVSASVVVHPGYFAWREERDRAAVQLKRSLAELDAAAGDLSIRYFVENMGNWDYFFLRTPEELELLGGAGFALDVGHAHLNGCLPAFLAFPIQHFHLHDNNGREDQHLPVGAGSIDFRTVMDAVRRNSAVPIVEVSTLEGTLASLRALKGLM